MGETVKLIIEIPKKTVNEIKDNAMFAWSISSDIRWDITNAIVNGTPLDDDPDRAEVQAYFDGEAYGWEQGRKALIDELKAEIIARDKYVKAIRSDNHCFFIVEEVLEILDNIGKAESEDI